jgi:3-hydroxyacyl-[acyl-carrier-protein] dehydratase
VAERAWLPPVIRHLRKAPLVADGQGTPVAIGRDAIERLIPHRAPMLLIDGIDRVDIDRDAVTGHRTIRRTDLGFDGHFADEPIYPGVLLIETMGQLGLTLLHFASSRSISVPSAAIPPRVRATHVHYAAFLAPVVPGDRLVLHAQVVDRGLTTIAAGQAYRNGSLAACVVSEVYVDE